jgi:phospho-N-acetylmuramoyl-pentapeptide-transferase
MLYYLFDYLDKYYDLAGAGVFQYITFRASLAALLSLLISLFIGKRIINFLKAKQIGETIRTVGPESHFSKKGTPTMGGIIIKDDTKKWRVNQQYIYKYDKNDLTKWDYFDNII